MVDLIIIVILSTAMVPAIEFSSGALRIVLGLVFALFSPGYTLVSALFPRREALSPIERVALSFGLSIAVVPLIGLVLNYTPWGIRLYPFLISVLAFIVAMAVTAWYRRRRLAPEDKFQFEIQPKLDITRHFWTYGRWDRVLTVVLIIALLGSFGTLGYVIAKPKVGKRFSQFYVLGPEGKATGYPKEIALGESASVVLGIVNNEHQPTTYRIEITIDGQRVGALGPIALEHEEKWEKEISFVPVKTGPRQEVEFWLYKDKGKEVCLKTHIWIDVKASGNSQIREEFVQQAILG